MISKIAKSSLSVLTSSRMAYGELKYTDKLKSQFEFDKVETFRAFDLDGKLINPNIKYNGN